MGIILIIVGLLFSGWFIDIYLSHICTNGLGFISVSAYNENHLCLIPALIDPSAIFLGILLVLL